MGERVKVEFEEVEIENERGYEQAGVRATCSRCDHTTESFGTGPKSRARCIRLLKDECPNNEENYYVDGDRDDDPPADPVPKQWWEK